MLNPIRMIAVVTCLFAATAVALGEGYNLRGPAPSVGETFRIESVVKMSEGDLNINAGGMRMAGKAGMNMFHTTETTILEMNDDSVTRVRIKYISDRQEQMMDLMGQRQTSENENPLHGQTIVGTYTDGSWSFELEQGSPNPALRAQLESLANTYRFDDKRAVYPDRKVKVGEEWEVDASDVQSHFAGADKPEGTFTIKLDKVEEVDGEPIAHLTVTMNVSSDVTADGPGEARMSMTATGPVLRSLKTFVDTSTNMTGRMEMNMSEGDDVEMNMSGPMEFTGKESRS